MERLDMSEEVIEYQKREREKEGEEDRKRGQKAGGGSAGVDSALSREQRTRE